MTVEAPEPIPGLALFIYKSMSEEVKKMTDLAITMHVTRSLCQVFPALEKNKIEKIKFYQDHYGRLCVENATPN